jgi:restriction system protein
VSPSGAVVSAWSERQGNVVRRLLKDQLAKVGWETFEQICGELAERLGFDDVEVTPPTGDGGIDIRASYDCAGISRQNFVFQVKRWSRPVGRRVIADLLLTLEDNEHGVVITTSSFRAGACTLAARWHGRISLVDGDRLTELLIHTGLGVRRTTVETLRIVGFAEPTRRLRTV